MSIRSCLTGPEIQRLPFPDHVWTCAQDHLETILAERAIQDGTQLRYGSQLTGLEPADGAVLATLAAAQGNGSCAIRAQYVVGADGAHSSVRQASGIAASRARGYGYWISVLFRSPLRHYTGDEPCMVYGIGDPSTSGVLVPADAPAPTTGCACAARRSSHRDSDVDDVDGRGILVHLIQDPDAGQVKAVTRCLPTPPPGQDGAVRPAPPAPA